MNKLTDFFTLLKSFPVVQAGISSVCVFLLKTGEQILLERHLGIPFNGTVHGRVQGLLYCCVGW